MPSRSVEALHQLFASEDVVEFAGIQAALGGASRATAFRYLKRVPYRRSYNHNGRYYTRHDPARYDRCGMWSHRDILFSRDGSLASTVVRLVQEAEAGHTQRELQDLLRVRVQVVLLEAARRGAIDREQVESLFVYLHIDPAVRQAQLQCRKEQVAAQHQAMTQADLSDAVVIDVLLILIRHPGAQPVDVVRRLHGRSPPITMVHVRAVFDRYDLDNLGEKGGPSNY